MKRNILLSILVPVALALSCAPPAPAPSGSGESGGAASRTLPKETPPTDVDSEVPYGGTLISATPSDIDGLNPLTLGTANARDISNQIFLYLASYDYVDDEYVLNKDYPYQLAEDWWFNDDKTVLTIKMKKGVKWHDGEEVTSRDAKFGLEYALDPKMLFQNVEYLKIIKKKPESEGKQGDRYMIETPDDYTVVVTLEKPNYNADVWVMNTVQPMPYHLLSKYSPEEIFHKQDKNFEQEFIGNGPYKFGHWTRNEEVRIVRNENFFIPGKPHIQERVVKVIPEVESRYSALQAGDIDLVGVQPKDVDRARSWDGVRLQVYPNRGYYYIGWNCAREPFKDRRFRQAMTFAVDRQMIVDTLLAGYGEIINGPLIPLNGRFYNPDVTSFDFNPEKAAELLDELGWTMGSDDYRRKGNQRLEFTLNCASNQPIWEETVKIMQQQLKEVGVKVNIDMLEWVALVDKSEDKDFDSMIMGWSTDFTVNPKDLWHSDNINVQDSFNFCSYSNPKVDKLIDDGLAETDPDKLQDIWWEFQEEVAKDQPYTFLYTNLAILAHSDKVVIPRPLDARGTWAQLPDWGIKP
jgi:peptide/nickel transport system substrate-binding protein